jgi:hypothetical protein
MSAAVDEEHFLSFIKIGAQRERTEREMTGNGKGCEL